MFKDGPFFLIVVQSETMPYFSGCISSSGRRLDNLFTSFESNYVGVIYKMIFSADNHYVFPGERLNNSQNSTFLKACSRRYGLKG